MDIKEAFYKQKEELRSCRSEVSRLQKQVDRYARGIAENETFRKQLSHIQGLNNKVAEQTLIADRYRTLYEQERDNYRELSVKFTELELRCQDLIRQIDCLTGKRSADGMTAAQRADAKIIALEDEVARLTALLSRDGTNTGTPTSGTPLDKKKLIPNSRKRSDRHIGGQPGHIKHSLAPFSDHEVTDIIHHELDRCPACGGSLSEIRDIPRDELDYEVRVVKKRHIFREYRCDSCGRTFRTSDPALKAENQYGPVIQAMALSLLDLGFVSISRTQKLLSGLTPESLCISQGYLSKLQRRFSRKLAPFVEEVRAASVSSGLLYWDDTVVSINTSRACFRFYGNERIALYCAHMKKDLAGILDDNVLPQLPSTAVVMHDHNTVNYHNGFVFINVECLQHLERDLQKVADQSSHLWAGEMKDLFASAIHDRSLLIAENIGCFDQTRISAFLSRYDALLNSGQRECSADDQRYFAQFENALLVRLRSYRQNYTAWLYDFRIPTTNNLSERALRFVKCKDKISGQFQNEAYAQFFASLRTYIETCSRNGVNEFRAILRLTQDNPYSLRELLSLCGAY